jgi:hypothetical protein
VVSAPAGIFAIRYPTGRVKIPVFDRVELEESQFAEGRLELGLDDGVR